MAKTLQEVRQGGKNPRPGSRAHLRNYIRTPKITYPHGATPEQKEADAEWRSKMSGQVPTHKVVGINPVAEESELDEADNSVTLNGQHYTIHKGSIKYPTHSTEVHHVIHNGNEIGYVRRHTFQKHRKIAGSRLVSPGRIQKGWSFHIKSEHKKPESGLLRYHQTHEHSSKMNAVAAMLNHHQIGGTHHEVKRSDGKRVNVFVPEFVNPPEEIQVNLAEGKDPPMMLILRRQAIRNYPGGKRIALFANPQLKIQIAVPYDYESGALEKSNLLPIKEAIYTDQASWEEDMREHGATDFDRSDTCILAKKSDGDVLGAWSVSDRHGITGLGTNLQAEDALREMTHVEKAVARAQGRHPQRCPICDRMAYEYEEEGHTAEKGQEIAAAHHAKHPELHEEWSYGDPVNISVDDASDEQQRPEGSSAKKSPAANTARSGDVHSHRDDDSISHQHYGLNVVEGEELDEGKSSRSRSRSHVRFTTGGLHASNLMALAFRQNPINRKRRMKKRTQRRHGWVQVHEDQLNEVTGVVTNAKRAAKDAFLAGHVSPNKFRASNGWSVEHMETHNKGSNGVTKYRVIGPYGHHHEVHVHHMEGTPVSLKMIEGLEEARKAPRLGLKGLRKPKTPKQVLRDDVNEGFKNIRLGAKVIATKDSNAVDALGNQNLIKKGTTGHYQGSHEGPRGPIHAVWWKSKGYKKVHFHTDREIKLNEDHDVDQQFTRAELEQMLTQTYQELIDKAAHTAVEAAIFNWLTDEIEEYGDFDEMPEENLRDNFDDLMALMSGALDGHSGDDEVPYRPSGISMQMQFPAQMTSEDDNKAAEETPEEHEADKREAKKGPAQARNHDMNFPAQVEPAVKQYDPKIARIKNMNLPDKTDPEMPFTYANPQGPQEYWWAHGSDADPVQEGHRPERKINDFATWHEQANRRGDAAFKLHNNGNSTSAFRNGKHIGTYHHDKRAGTLKEAELPGLTYHRYHSMQRRLTPSPTRMDLQKTYDSTFHSNPGWTTAQRTAHVEKAHGVKNVQLHHHAMVGSNQTGRLSTVIGFDRLHEEVINETPFMRIQGIMRRGEPAKVRFLNGDEATIHHKTGELLNALFTRLTPGSAHLHKLSQLVNSSHAGMKKVHAFAKQALGKT